jgi:hypothetical protein
VIAADKLWFDEEFLPDENILNEKSTRVYNTYLKLLDEYECDYINLNAAFVNLKKRGTGTLFANGGQHWTEYGGYIAIDSIVDYLKLKTRFGFPEVKLEKLRVDKNPWYLDEDIFNACNLQFKIASGNKFSHPELSSLKKERKTTALLCGDSFSHAICWTNFYSLYFNKESTFWYYNREIYKANNVFIDNVNDENAVKFIEKSDIYIVLYSAGNLEKFEYGFLDHFVK